jgi:hypothetical protein
MMSPTWSLELSAAPAEAVDLLAVGDVSLPPGDCYGAFRRVARWYHPDVLSILHAKDVSVADLECPVVASPNPIPKYGPSLHGSPDTIDALTQAHFDVVSMANNHILDYGPQAMFETRDRCRAAGVQTVGVGRDLDEAQQPLCVTKNGVRLAILAFAEQEFSGATRVLAGAAILDIAAAPGIIRAARQQADAVVCILHAGQMYYPLPTPRTQRWCRLLAESGATAVIGHHPHCVQGMEVHHGVPILYSLGNFFFPNPGTAAPPRCWHIGLIARLRLSKAGAHRVELFASKQAESNESDAVGPLPESLHDAWRKRLFRLHEITASPDLVDKFWTCYCHAHRLSYCSTLLAMAGLSSAKVEFLFKNGVKSVAPHYAGLIQSVLLGRFVTRKKIRQEAMCCLTNLFRCPTHQEAMIRIFELATSGEQPDPRVWSEYLELMVDGE